MQVTANEIAHIVNGKIQGNADTIVTHPAGIEDGGQGAISFLDNPKYEPYAYTTNSSVLLVNENFTPTQEIKATLIRVENVRVAVATLLNAFGEGVTKISGISEHAFIHKNAKIGNNVAIGHFTVVDDGAVIADNTILHNQVYIGKNVQIGVDCELSSGVKVYHDCKIGNRVNIHSNTVIGSDGFGFAPQADGTYKKVAQIGIVILEDDVEIGANTVIDRATMDSTIIRKGVKLDNLIQIAHNVDIGENTVIAAQTGIAGTTKIGKNNQIGGQAGFAGHLSTADGVRVQAQSGINASIKQENAAVYGSPAIAYRDFLRAYSIFKKLPDLEKRVRELEQDLKNKT